MQRAAKKTERPTEKGIKDVYRKWAPIYDRHMKDTGHIGALEQLLNYLPHYLGRRGILLDIACGTCTAVDYIMNRSAWTRNNYPKVIVANDFSPDMLSYARRKLRMRVSDTLMATLNEMLSIARDTRYDGQLRGIASRNALIQNGLLPRVGFLSQDATNMEITIPIDAVL